MEFGVPMIFKLRPERHYIFHTKTHKYNKWYFEQGIPKFQMFF